MRKLIASDYTTGDIMFPLKIGSINHIQSSYDDVMKWITELLISENFDSSKVYKLYTYADTGGIQAFLFYYNREIWYCPGANPYPTLGVGQVYLLNENITYDTSAGYDPVTFVDSGTGATTTHDVHQIKEGAIGVGTSGTGTICNLDDLVPIRTSFKSTFNDTSTAITVKFDQPSFLYNSYGSSGTVTITLDGTNAVVGTIARITFNAGYSRTVVIAVASGQFVKQTGAILTGVTGILDVQIQYMGNDGTNDVFIAVKTMPY